MRREYVSVWDIYPGSLSQTIAFPKNRMALHSNAKGARIIPMRKQVLKQNLEWLWSGENAGQLTAKYVF